MSTLAVKEAVKRIKTRAKEVLDVLMITTFSAVTVSSLRIMAITARKVSRLFSIFNGSYKAFLLDFYFVSCK